MTVGVVFSGHPESPLSGTIKKKNLVRVSWCSFPENTEHMHNAIQINQRLYEGSIDFLFLLFRFELLPGSGAHRTTGLLLGTPSSASPLLRRASSVFPVVAPAAVSFLHSQ